MSTKVAIVTGGTRGIGRATAIALAEEGYSVVTCGRDVEGLRATESLLAIAGTAHLVLEADLSRKQDVEAVIERSLDRFGRVDVLVNNAGTAPLASIETISDATFEETFALNCSAIFYAVRKVWPAMSAQGGGTIVSISSLASFDPFPGFQIYGASKAWVNLFTKSIADEGKPLGIRAYALALGAVETQMLRAAFPDFQGQPILSPEEVANGIVALTQPAWIHASGSTIPLRK